MTVYKFPIEGDGLTTVEIPMGAKVLCAKFQDGHVNIYALVDIRAPRVQRAFAIRATGYSITHEHLEYIDSFTVPNSTLTFHVFEVLP